MPSSRNSPKLKSGTRYGGGTHGGAGRTVSYGEIPGDLLHRVIIAVTGAGDAVTFGRTSERGAYYIGVLADGALERFYLDSCEAAQDALRDIAEAGEALIV